MTLIAPYAIFHADDANGAPLSGGLLYTYIAGTATKQATFTDSAGGTANTNPVKLNGRGEASIWLTSGLSYKFVLSPSTDTDPPTNPIWTQDNVQSPTGLLTIANNTLLGNSSGSSAVPTAQPLGNNISLFGGKLTAIPFNFISGFTLSNDVAAPTTRLDIAFGQCTDSTNLVLITLPAMIKSISGPWAAGSAQQGMGAGLTATANTWYHVFSIVNNGTADAYFDTSAIAANRPAGTTVFRRIGSIFLTASVQILSFVQLGDTFMWASELLSVNNAALSGTTAVFPIGVPPNIPVTASIRVLAGNSNAWSVTVYSPVTTTPFTSVPSLIGAAGIQAAGQMQIVTDGSQHIVVVGTVGTSFNVAVSGWIDHRGPVS